MADSKREFEALLKRLAAPAQTARWQDAPVLPEGSTVDDKYQVVRLLGRGGMGEVYEVRAADQRVYALKCLSLALAADRSAHMRFEAEARAAGSLGHPNIVRLFESGDLPDGRPYVCMERVHGETLNRLLERRPVLPLVELVALAIELCDALMAAHGHGIVHRDLKPANVFVLAPDDASEARVKLGDFGVAKLLTPTGTRLTTTGVTLGTPHFMAPEQVRGERAIDGRADLYALGVLLYQCATGRLPFDAKSFAQLAVEICSAAPTPLRALRPEASPAFETLVHTALQKEPRARFPHAAAMQDALRALLR